MLVPLDGVVDVPEPELLPKPDGLPNPEELPPNPVAFVELAPPPSRLDFAFNCSIRGS